MKKSLSARLTAVLLALCLCLTACGAKSNSSYVYGESSSAAYAEAPMPAAAQYKESAYDEEAAHWDMEIPAEPDAIAVGESGSAVPASDRKIVYTGSMELQTKEFDDALAAITKLVGEAGGYVSSQEVSGRSLTYRGNYYERRASLTIRVPAKKFDSLMSGVAGICNVTDRSVWTDDISERYYDAEVHLSTLRLQEERLLEILSKAEKLEDVITLEQALSDVRYEIESLTAQLRRMKDQVDYSTLTLTLQEVVEYSEVEAPPATFGEKVSEAAKRSAQSIGDFFEGLILWIIEDLPLVLLWLLLICFVLWVLVRVLRFIFRRTGAPSGEKKPLFRRGKKNEGAAPAEEPRDGQEPPRN